MILIGSLLSLGTPAANAVDYTVTYNANSGQVGAYAQVGVVTGTVPSPVTQASGTTVTVAAQGSMTRQGFVLSSWNTAANGSGTSYTPGSGTFTLSASVTLYALWTIPVAARLIGNGGALITTANTNNITNGAYCVGQGIRGITSDGTNIFFRPSGYSGYICKVTPAGVVISVNSVTGLSGVGSDSIALTYGNGCIFLRKDSQTTLSSIYCIDVSTWAMVSINTPAGYPLFQGTTWLYANMITFPDGRIGAVSGSALSTSYRGGEGTGSGQCPATMYCKTLRLYTPTGTGSSVSLAFSTDFVLADTESGWPGDDHGIATDGTYLYQIRHANGYKVWALRNGLPSYLVYNADVTGQTCTASTGVTPATGSLCTITYPVDGNPASANAFGNGTYLGRSHGLGKYLIGDYSGSSRFWLSDPATPPPGPGNPDLTPPTFSSADTFTVAENISTSFNAATITVNESSTITISAGSDNSLFNIIYLDDYNAYIRFKTSPDFEGPLDSGGNNIYDITISATDAAGNTGVRAINIRVTNVNESSVIGSPTVSGFVYKGVQTTISLTVNAPGKVKFLLGGKRISGCLSRPTTGSYPNYTATCTWKPPIMGRQLLTAAFTPTDITFTSGNSGTAEVWVIKRTTRR